MNSKESKIKINVMTRSEYIASKHLPLVYPMKQLHADDTQYPITSTRLPIERRSVHFSSVAEEELAGRTHSYLKPGDQSEELDSLRLEVENLNRNNQNMANSVEKLREALKASQSENELLQERIDRLIQENDNKDMIISSIQKDKDDLEARVKEIQRNERLHSSNREIELHNHIEKLQSTVAKLEEELEEAQVKLVQADHMEELDALRQENENLLSQIEEMNGLRDALAKSKCEEKMHTVLFSIEIERLHQLLAAKIEENADLARQLELLRGRPTEERSTSPYPKTEGSKTSGIAGEIVSQSSQKQNALQREIAELKSTIEAMEKSHQQELEALRLSQHQQLDSSMNETVENLNRQVSSLQQKIDNDLLNKVLVMIEIDRLHSVIQNLSDEIEQLENENDSMRETHFKEIQQLQQKFEEFKITAIRGDSAKTDTTSDAQALQDEVLRLKRELFNKGSETENLKYQNSMIEKKYRLEIESLRHELTLRISIEQELSENKENISGAKNNSGERSLIERLLRTQKDRINDLEEITSALQGEMHKNRKVGDINKEPFDTQITTYRAWTEELLATISTLQNEVQAEKKESFEKGLEIENWKRKFAILEANYTNDRERMKTDIEVFLRPFDTNQNLVAEFHKYWNKEPNKQVEPAPEDHFSFGYKAPQRVQRDYLHISYSPARLMDMQHGPNADAMNSKTADLSIFRPNLQAMAADRNKSSSPNSRMVATEPDLKKSQNLPLRQEESYFEEKYQVNRKDKSGSKQYGHIRNQSLNQSPNNPRTSIYEYEDQAESHPDQSQPQIRVPTQGSNEDYPHSPIMRKTARGEAYFEAKEDPEPIGRINRFDTKQPAELTQNRASAPVAHQLKTSNGDIKDSMVSKSVPSLNGQYYTLSYNPNFESTNADDRSTNEVQSFGSRNYDSVTERHRDMPRSTERSSSEDPRAIQAKPTQTISPMYLKKLQDSEARLILTCVELERITHLLRQKTDEADQLKRRLSDQEGKLNDFAGNANLIRSVASTKDLLRSQSGWNTEKVTLERLLNIQKETLRDQEMKIQLLNSQMEALSNENSVLAAAERNSKFDLEKAKLNYESSLKQILSRELAEQTLSHTEEKMELEKKLRDERLKTEDLENKAVYLMKENERLMEVVEERDRDINKLLADNKERARELQEMHNQLIAEETKARLVISELRKKIEDEKDNELRQQAAKLRSEHEAEIARLKQEIHYHLAKSPEKDGRIQEISDHVDRLSHELQEKEHELALLNEKLARAEEKHQREKEELRADFERGFKTRLDSELKRLNDRNAIEKTMMDSENRRLKGKCEELERYTEERDKTVDELVNKLSDKEHEVETWKKNYDQQERSLQLEITNLKHEYEIRVKNQFQGKINEMTKDFERERNTLEDAVKRARGRIQELETRTIMLMIELDRQGIIRVRAEEELKEFKQKELEMQRQHQEEMEGLKSQWEKMLRSRIEMEAKESYRRYEREQEALEGEVEDLKARLKELENLVEDLNANNSKLSEELLSVRKEKKALLDRCNLLEEKKNDLEGTVIMINLDRERIERERDALAADLEVAGQTLIQKQGEHERKVSALARDNKRVQEELEHKESALRELRDQFEKTKQDMMEYVNNLKNQLEENKKYEINAAVSAVEKKAQEQQEYLRAELQEAQTDLGERERHIERLQTELETLNQQASAKMNENEKLRVQINELHKDYKKKLQEQNDHLNEEKARELQDCLENQARTFEKERNGLVNQISDMQYQKKQLNEEKERKQAEVNEMKQNIADLKVESENALAEQKGRLEADFYKRLDGLKNEFNNERASLEAKLRELAKKLQDSENQNQRLSAEIQELKTLLDEKLREIEELKDEIERVENEKEALLEQFKAQFDLFKNSAIGVGDFEIRYKAEKSAYESQILELQGKLALAEEAVINLEKENKRLKDSGAFSVGLAGKQKELQDKIEELDQLKVKYEEAMKNINIGSVLNVFQSKTREKRGVSANSRGPTIGGMNGGESNMK